MCVYVLLTPFYATNCKQISCNEWTHSAERTEQQQAERREQRIEPTTARTAKTNGASYNHCCCSAWLLPRCNGGFTLTYTNTKKKCAQAKFTKRALNQCHLHTSPQRGIKKKIIYIIKLISFTHDLATQQNLTKCVRCTLYSNTFELNWRVIEHNTTDPRPV